MNIRWERRKFPLEGGGIALIMLCFSCISSSYYFLKWVQNSLLPLGLTLGNDGDVIFWSFFSTLCISIAILIFLLFTDWLCFLYNDLNLKGSTLVTLFTSRSMIGLSMGVNIYDCRYFWLREISLWLLLVLSIFYSRSKSIIFWGYGYFFVLSTTFTSLRPILEKVVGLRNVTAFSSSSISSISGLESDPL